MKRHGILGILLLLLPMATWAITDNQVINLAQEMYLQGKSENVIAQELIKKGASISQLQRLKSQITNGASTTGKSAQAQTEVKRVNNGETSPAVKTTKQQSTKKEVFGQDIFRKKSMTFEPQMNIATPKNYVLGPGDQVVVDIYGASQQQFVNDITPDGNITISDYGPIQLAGLDLQQATRKLRSTLGSRYQQCQILLTIGQTRTISVNILGEVEVPGTYQLSAFASVFHALYMAGGVSEAGTLRAIKVYRGSKLVSTIDLYEYLMNGNMEGQERLEDGDVILVGAYQSLVKIDGSIKRPMYYEMQQGETMDKLLYYAGGFSGNAYTAAIRVNRNAGGAPSVQTVRNDGFATFALMDGDEAIVEAILPRLQNTVEIEGAVFREGQYGISDGLKTVRQLVDMANGPREDAFLSRAVLYRMNLDRTLKAVPIDLQGILEDEAKDIELRNEDKLFIPSVREKLDKQYVVIHGEVYHPDTFQFAENESVEDLVLRAGGLTEFAATSKVDIARRIVDPKATNENAIKSKTYTVELQDNLEVGEHGFILEPFDEVYIRRSPAYGKQMNVQVRGEILFDGTYAMKTQDDRLSDLVKAAGGLSSHAYVKGARLLRHMNEEERVRRERLLKFNKAANENESVDLDKLDIDSIYYVGIDLEAALKNPGSNEDIILREGDILIVPSKNTTVKINGEVLFPNTVSYISGKRAHYYINQAGGYSNQAKRNRAYIIYANGKVGTRYDKVQPGCEIVVPSRPDHKATNAALFVSAASASASMASGIAVIANLIVNMTKK